MKPEYLIPVARIYLPEEATLIRRHKHRGAYYSKAGKTVWMPVLILKRGYTQKRIETVKAGEYKTVTYEFVKLMTGEVLNHDVRYKLRGGKFWTRLNSLRPSNFKAASAMRTETPEEYALRLRRHVKPKSKTPEPEPDQLIEPNRDEPDDDADKAIIIRHTAPQDKSTQENQAAKLNEDELDDDDDDQVALFTGDPDVYQETYRGVIIWYHRYDGYYHFSYMSKRYERSTIVKARAEIDRLIDGDNGNGENGGDVVAETYRGITIYKHKSPLYYHFVYTGTTYKRDTIPLCRLKIDKLIDGDDDDDDDDENGNGANGNGKEPHGKLLLLAGSVIVAIIIGAIAISSK